MKDFLHRAEEGALTPEYLDSLLPRAHGCPLCNGLAVCRAGCARARPVNDDNREDLCDHVCTGMAIEDLEEGR